MLNNLLTEEYNGEIYYIGEHTFHKRCGYRYLSIMACKEILERLHKYEEMFAVGAMFRNIVSDDRSIGVYASYTGLEGFTFNAGYTNNGEIEDFNVVGDFINAAVMFESDAFALNVDAAFSLDSDDNTTNDLYTAVLAGYQVNDALAVKLYGAFTTDFDNDDTWVFTVKPYVEYAINEHNTISGGVSVGISKPEKAISFPVSWVYTY